MERMCADILTRPLQGRTFGELRVELMNFLVDYEDKSTCVDVGKTTGVYGTKCVHTGNTNARYRSYTEATIKTIKYPMDSPQECFGGTQSSEVTGRYRRWGLPVVMGSSFLTEVTGSVRQLYRI